MSTTGERLGELLDIYMVRDINLETNTITIDTQVTMDCSWRPLKTTRRIFVQPEVLRAVLEMTPRSKKDPKKAATLVVADFWGLLVPMVIPENISWKDFSSVVSHI